MLDRSCLRCHELRRHEGRGLCKRCYFDEWRAGRISEWATQRKRSIVDWLAITDTSDPGGCWMWPGATDHYGYGSVNPSVGGSPKAHRAVYEHLVSPVPPGAVLDHMCHKADRCSGGIACPHRRCVNPMHLVIATSTGNTVRSASERPTCRKGHPWNTENTAYRRDAKARGGVSRYCRACRYLSRPQRGQGETTWLGVLGTA